MQCGNYSIDLPELGEGEQYRFHFNEQLINNITIPEFDPKSFEPNYKQCAVYVHSKAVPEGIVYNKEEISGYLEGVKVYKKEVFSEESVDTIAK